MVCSSLNVGMWSSAFEKSQWCDFLWFNLEHLKRVRSLAHSFCYLPWWTKLIAISFYLYWVSIIRVKKNLFLWVKQKCSLSSINVLSLMVQHTSWVDLKRPFLVMHKTECDFSQFLDWCHQQRDMTDSWSQSSYHFLTVKTWCLLLHKRVKNTLLCLNSSYALQSFDAEANRTDKLSDATSIQFMSTEVNATTETNAPIKLRTMIAGYM